MAFLELVAGTARAGIIAPDFAQRVAHRRLDRVVVIMVVVTVRAMNMLMVVVVLVLVIAIRAMNMAVGMRVHENS